MNPTGIEQAPRFRFPLTAAVIWAMGTQTLRQCLRRKVLFVLVLFVGAVIVSMQVTPTHDPLKRLEILIATSLKLTSFFGIIVAVFLAATVLPQDRTDKTIVTVLTKPVGRLNYIVGRVFGFALTLGIIILVMGLVSWAFIRWEGSRVDESGELLVARRGIEPTQVILDLRGKERRPFADDSQKYILKKSVRNGLVFCFRSDLEQLPQGEQTIELTPMVWATMGMSNVEGDIVVRNPVTGSEIKIPLEREREDDEEGEGRLGPLDGNRTKMVSFPGELIDATEGVEVILTRRQYGAVIRFDRGAFRILTPPGSFEYNYFKSLVVVYFGFMLIVVVSITASVFLGSWVAVLAGFTAYFFSASQEIILDFMHRLEGESAGFLGMALGGHGHKGPLPVEPDSFLVVCVNKVLYGGMWVLTHIFPSFDTFDTSGYLSKARDIPVWDVSSAAFVLVAYGICYLLIGHYLFCKREVMP